MNFFLLFINIEELLYYKNIAKTLKLYDSLLDPHVAITTFFNSEKCIQFLKCEKCVDVPLIWNFLLSFLRSGKQSLCMTFPCFHNDISYCREVIIFPCLLWFILGFFYTFGVGRTQYWEKLFWVWLDQAYFFQHTVHQPG